MDYLFGIGKQWLVLIVLLFIFLGSVSCATYRSREGVRITRGIPESKKCPDTMDRARIGGMAGSALGGMAAAMGGSSVFGAAIHFVGYAVGFTSKDTCSSGNKKKNYRSEG